MKFPFKNPAPPAAQPAKLSHTHILSFGLTMILAAFMGVCLIFYFLNNSIQSQEEKIKNLIENTAHLGEEKNILELEIQNLKAQGDSIKFDKLLAEAQGVYAPAEKNRKEGILWIDKNKKIWVVTLGALNGAKLGSQVGIYEGDKKIGEVKVTMPLDVISYVEPARSEQPFVNHHYRAVIE